MPALASKSCEFRLRHLLPHWLKYVYGKGHRVGSTVRCGRNHGIGACAGAGAGSAATASSAPTPATATATSGNSEHEGESHNPRSHAHAPSQLFQLPAEENEGHAGHRGKSGGCGQIPVWTSDRKSTRLNSSHS